MVLRALRAGARRVRYPAVAVLSLLALTTPVARPTDPVGARIADAAPRDSSGGRAVDGGAPLFLAPPTDPRDPRDPLPRNTEPVADDRTTGVPATVLAAYRRAADQLGRTTPACSLTWPVLAGIGKVESNHARNGDVTPAGDPIDPIYGPMLNGANGFAAIPDTAGGWARAAGPMQFIPSTWAVWGADGDGDGRADVQNVFDASLAAARYLCADGRDLATGNGLRDAILSYNHSAPYLDTVSRWIRAYQHGGGPVPDSPAEPGTYRAFPAEAPATPTSRPQPHPSAPAPGSPPPNPPPNRTPPTSPPARTPPSTPPSAPPRGSEPPLLPLPPLLGVLVAAPGDQQPPTPASPPTLASPLTPPVRH